MIDIIKQMSWLLSGERVGVRTRMGARKTIRRIFPEVQMRSAGDKEVAEDVGRSEWLRAV